VARESELLTEREKLRNRVAALVQANGELHADRKRHRDILKETAGLLGAEDIIAETDAKEEMHAGEAPRDVCVAEKRLSMQLSSSTLQDTSLIFS
jgi:hypothetical protein